MLQPVSKLQGMLEAVAGGWRWLREKGAHVRELDRCGREVEWIASELGMSVAELRRTAAKGPRASREVYDRLGALGLRRQAVDPATMRDLERVCSQCDAKRRCRSDLGRASVSIRDEYCPNAGTLVALAQACLVSRNRAEGTFGTEWRRRFTH